MSVPTHPAPREGTPTSRVSKSLRYEILRRDGHACRYCGRTAPDVKLTVDHVTPVALGGRTEPSNLVAACADCNAGKKTTPPGAPLVEDVSERDLQWVKALEVARSRARAARRETGNLHDSFIECWESVTGGAWVPDTWRRSFDAFLKAGLEPADIGDAIAITGRAGIDRYDLWRYFCGVCWRMVTDLQNAAAKLVADGEV